MMILEQSLHIPVMKEQVIELLKLKPGMTVIDATVGTGGHAQEILEKIRPRGKLIGVDRDKESIAIAEDRLGKFEDSITLIHQNFRDLDKISIELNITNVDAILFDLGISSFQLDMPQRGFSFTQEGPLDMRLDRESYISAYDLVNNLSVKELSGILRNFGEERWHYRIAHFVINERVRKPISSTRQLADIILRAVPHYTRYAKIHPATRTFQALRIAVNRELEALGEGLSKAIALLKPTGRICVISFHSLEDRIVKRKFLSSAHNEEIKIITPKPLSASGEEIGFNPRSRSAKLRCAEKIK